jgi:hypothetical protein
LVTLDGESTRDDASADGMVVDEVGGSVWG